MKYKKNIVKYIIVREKIEQDEPLMQKLYDDAERK